MTHILTTEARPSFRGLPPVKLSPLHWSRPPCGTLGDPSLHHPPSWKTIERKTINSRLAGFSRSHLQATSLDADRSKRRDCTSCISKWMLDTNLTAHQQLRKGATQGFVGNKNVETSRSTRGLFVHFNVCRSCYITMFIF